VSVQSWLCAVVCAIVVSPFSYAQNSQTPKKPVVMDRLMFITYGSPSWNKDSSKVDTAFIFMRDKTSGRIAQIQLEETEPDSSQFKGQFNVSLNESEKISPEIYIAPTSLREADQDNKKLYELIKAGKIPRKPLVWKKSARGQTVLDVYDTREQGESAYKVYQEEQKLLALTRGKKLAKPVLSDSTLDTARQAELKNLLSKLAKESAKHEANRIRMEQIERQKADLRMARLNQMPEAERNEQKRLADVAAKTAMGFYTQGKFLEAQASFKKSVDLDPSVTSVLYNFGVVQYRNEKFNESIVALRMSKVDPQTDAERKYYMALNHYRLSELVSAMKLFEEVGASQNPVLGPSAVFYQGVIYFTEEKFEQAKKAFETVIDISQDAKMDDQAEAYLDRLAAAMAFAKMRENKWTVSGTLGLMYDSNVLLAPDNASDQGSATDIEDARLLTVLDLEYRPIFTEHHEASAKATVTMINSVKEDAAKADPFLYTFSAPYTYKGIVWKKGYKLTAKPGYEVLYMAPSGGTKTQQQASPFFSLDNTFVMNPEIFSVYSFEYRADDTVTPDAIGPNDSDASKIGLKTSQIFILDKAKKQMFIANLGYSINAAKGDNKKYARIDAGATYLQPLKWDVTWNAGLSMYRVNYGSADPSRTDFNTTLSTAVSKPIRDWVTWSFLANYSKNDSDVSANEYSKYTVMTTATFVTSF